MILGRSGPEQHLGGGICWPRVWSSKSRSKRKDKLTYGYQTYWNGNLRASNIAGIFLFKAFTIREHLFLDWLEARGER